MEAAFLKILNMSITATWIALAVMLVRIPLKRAPKWISYALWAIVLFRLVCPVSFSSGFSLLGSVGAPVAQTGGISYIPQDIATSERPAVDLIVPAVSDAVNDALPLATQEASVNPVQIWLTAGSCVWLAGIALMLVYSLISYLKLRRRIADATLVSDDIYETDAIDSPFVYGILRPRIYLPLSLAEVERAYVLMHEQTHIRRRDYLIKPFALCALCLHWFNPVIWLVFRLMSLDMEMSCDERVIKEFSREQTADYGETLLRLRVKRPMLAGSPVAFNENSTKGRIKNVLNYKKPAFWAVAVALAAAAVAGVCLLSNPKPADNEPDPDAGAALSGTHAQTAMQGTPVPVQTQTDSLGSIEYDPLASAITIILGANFDRGYFDETLSNYPGALHYSVIMNDFRCFIDTGVLLDVELQKNAGWVDGFLERFLNGRTFILDYLAENAPGCYDETAAQRPVSLTVDCTNIRFESTEQEIKVYTNRYYWRANELYIFSLMNQDELHWQHYGLAWYLGGVLNPYDEMLYMMQGNNINDFGPYAETFFSHGGSTTNMDDADYRILHDSVAYKCLTQGMGWGNDYESAPLNELNYYHNKMDAEGDDMSVVMATSFTAWLADNYGFDKVVSFCSGQTDFEGAFGGTYGDINGRWRVWILDTYGE